MMLVIQDRDRLLHEVYQNRELLKFTHGEEYFQQQVHDILWDWEQSGTWLLVDDMDITISQVAFEIDNGY